MESTSYLVKNLILDFRQKLAGVYPDQEIRQFIYLLFEEYLGWEKTRVHLSLEAEIPQIEMRSFNLALAELSAGKPIQYILGKSWFNGTLLKVDANVLIPRPETEELCLLIKADHAGEQNQHIAILDIGTGSGCIAIDLKKQFPFAEVTAVDNSIGALEVAGVNARSNQCEIFFIHSDILNQEAWENLGKYHVIVSNPPYVLESEKIRMHRNVAEFEPLQALFVDDEDPLVFYKAISGFAASHLIPPGRLYVEINEQFGSEVKDLAYSFGFDDVMILNDLHGKERIVSAKLKSRSTPAR